MSALRRLRERGVSLSVFVATVVVSLLMMGGLVVDGGSQAAASRACQQTAAEAARAGSDAAALYRAGGREVDPGVARAAAISLLNRTPGLSSHSVVVTGDQVRVTVTKSSPTVFLSLMGINALNASGEATASLRPTGG